MEETTALDILDTSDFNDNIAICNVDFPNFQKICRFCLGVDNLKPLFNMTYNLVSVQSIIFDCLSLKVSPEDQLPSNLCEVCVAELLRFYKFRNTCIETSNVLQNAYDNFMKGDEATIQMSNSECYGTDTNNLIIKGEGVDNYIPIPNDYILENNLIIKNEGSESLLIIYNDIDDTNNVNFVIKDEGTKDTAIIQNDTNSDYLIINRNEIEATPTICNNEILEDRHENEEISGAPIYNCNILEDTESDNWKIKNKEMDEELNLCNSYIAEDTDNCRLLIDTEKTEDAPTICNDNITNDTDQNKPVDRKITKVVKPRIRRKRPIKQTDYRPHVCKCAQAFLTKAALIAHTQIHRPKKLYNCSQCKKAFLRKRFYERHMLIHTGERPYKCIICMKAFIHKTSFDKHMLVHKGERPYECGVCGRSFIHKSYLKTHMLTHTGEKPHVCGLCEKAFSQKSALNVHMLIHKRNKK